MSYENVSDEGLMTLIADADVDALDAFYERHSRAAYHVILRIVRSPELADELLQESFWQVWQKATTYEGRGVPAAWLFRIARNKSLDLLRRQKARPVPVRNATEEAEMLMWAQLPDENADVGHQVQAQWEREHVRQALTKLPAEQKECLELAFFGGLTQREIAERTGAPLGTVKTRIRLALAKMQRFLQAT